MSLVRAQKSDRSGAVDALHLIHLTSFHTSLTLVAGTLSSAVTGAIGGLAGKIFGGGRHGVRLGGLAGNTACGDSPLTDAL